MSEHQISNFEKAHGILPSTPPSMMLWAHLLRKEPSSAPLQSGGVLPPITPLDKNATSMRILLHDTQANFENFSEKVDKLCATVEESKREIAMVNTLFQREHETIMGDIVDLVNRSQTELQKSIGEPVRAQEFSQVRKDLELRLEALDRRMDTIQTFNQSHSQILQVLSQALQSLQDQHGTIIAAVMPVLPLLQAVPLHIEKALNEIKDFVLVTPATRNNAPAFERSGRLGEKRVVSPSMEHIPSPSTIKRPRTDTLTGTRKASVALNTLTTEDVTHRHNSAPTGSRQHGNADPESFRAHKSEQSNEQASPIAVTSLSSPLFCKATPLAQGLSLFHSTASNPTPSVSASGGGPTYSPIAPRNPKMLVPSSRARTQDCFVATTGPPPALEKDRPLPITIRPPKSLVEHCLTRSQTRASTLRAPKPTSSFGPRNPSIVNVAPRPRPRPLSVRPPSVQRQGTIASSTQRTNNIHLGLVRETPSNKKLKLQLSPPREGRRFIPLDDDSDEDEPVEDIETTSH